MYIFISDIIKVNFIKWHTWIKQRNVILKVLSEYMGEVVTSDMKIDLSN